MSEKIKLTKINVLNNYIAVLQHIDVPEGIEIPEEELKKLSNEGIVVGIGPDAEGVELGDRIIVHPRKYLTLSPSKGGFKGEAVMMIKQLDAVAIIGKTDKYDIS